MKSKKSKIRVLVAKPGLDGHDVGGKILVQALKDASFDVVYSGLKKSPETIIEMARQEMVDVIGVSVLSGSHLPICERISTLIDEYGLQDKLWLVGGNIPAGDHQKLKDMGVDQVFAVGSYTLDIVDYINDHFAVDAVGPDKSENISRESKKEIGLKPVFNESGIEIKPLYTPKDLEESGRQLEDIGNPGEFPFTRGIHKEMYRKRPWTMRQYAGFGTPHETNKRFRYLIENGQNGLNVAFDLPTQTGLDSDDPMAEGEVGRVGMAVDTLRDFEIAFEEIDLEKITVSLTINGSAAILIAMYFAMAQKRGYDVSKLRGTAQNDILKEFIGRGTWIFPVDHSVKLVSDTIMFCAEKAPLYSPVSVCGYHIRESGANPVEEIAYAFCIAKAYIDHVLERGLDIDEFASRLSFNFDIFGNLFEQVAKFRAARRLWAKIIKEQYSAKNPKSMWMRMIAGGGGGGLTIEQPENNIIRSSYYALISALSGTQTMALCSYDEAYTIPSEKAARLSLRTMQILMEEMGLCDTVDPLAGSYYVETLTSQMEQKIIASMQKVDQAGGIVQSVAKGEVQKAVSRQAYEEFLKVQNGQNRKVGVNCFKIDETKQPIEFHPFEAEDCLRQVERLNDIRNKRDNEEVIRCLKSIYEDAKAGNNVMPSIIKAVKAYATVGEINKSLLEVYGHYQEPILI